MLFDGRNKAQNGWFVIRTLMPAGKTGDVVVWHIRPNVVAGWTRPPVVGYNQVGYTLGRHPMSNVSYVTSVGAESKLIAYGNNRADYTFVPGGIIPGVVIRRSSWRRTRRTRKRRARREW